MPLLRPAIAIAATLLMLTPLGSRGEERPSALLLADPSAAGLSPAALRGLAERLGGAYRLLSPADLPAIATRDEGCGPAADAARAETLRVLDEGTTLFFDDTDMDAARNALTVGLERWLGDPCTAGASAADRTAAVAAGVLRVRLDLMHGRPESAAGFARRLVRAFTPDEVAAVDVPPDVREFLAGVVRDAATGAGPLRVEVRPDRPAGTRIHVDGRPGASDGPVAVPAGEHRVTVVLPSGAAATARVATAGGPSSIAVDRELSPALLPGPEGTWQVAPDAPADAADRLAGLSGATVLRLEGAEGSGSVRAVPGGREVLRLEARPDRIDLALGEGSPRAERPSWPWPWVTGAVAAGLLGAGVALNVLANDSADAVNGGTNRLDEWRSRRAGAIACYALSGAAAVGTAVLLAFRPEAGTRIRVDPLPRGAALGVQRSF